MKKKSSITKDYSDEIARLKAQLHSKEQKITALRDEKEKYLRLLETATDWIYWIGPQGIFHYISSGCKNITGYEPREFMNDPGLLLRIVHPDDRERVARQLKKELQNRDTCSNEFRIITKSGQTRWIWHQCRPVFDSKGMLVGRRAGNRDITALLLAQQELKESRELLGMVFDGMPDPIHMINEKFEIELSNRTLLDLKGLHLDAIRGKHCYEMYQGRESKCEPCAADEAFKTGQTARLIKTLPLPNGKQKYFEVFAYPVKDASGRVTHVIELTRDISAQKELEAALRRSRDQYEQLATTMPLGILSCDQNGNLTFANEAMLKILGSPSLEQTLQFNVLELPLLERFGISEKIKKTLQSGARFVFQTEYVSKWGKQSVLRIHIDPLRNTNGHIEGALGLVEDVTEYTRLQHALAKSEQKFHDIFEFSPNGIILIDEAFKIVEVNQKITEITGFGKKELLGEYIWDMAVHLVPKSQKHQKNKAYFKKLLKDNLKRLQSSNLPVEFETVIQDKKGRIRYLQESAFQIRINGDSFLVNIKSDITDRYLAQQALEESEKRFKEMYRLFRLIADNDPDMLWAKDLQGRFIFTNKAICERLLGAKDVNEPIGKDDLYFAKRLQNLHPENPEWHNFSEACLDSDKITLQAQKPMRFKEFGNVMGKFMFLDVYKAPLRDESGKIIGTVGSARDITEEKAIEKEKERIQDELKRLATVIEQADVAIIITDTAGIMQYVNRAFESDTGYSKEEALGQNPRILKSGEHPREFFKDLWDTITAGKTWHNTIINRKKDGTLYHEDAIIFPIFDSQGKIANYAAILRDITKEQELEKQVRHMQKMESIGILTGGIAHDFNNLLTVINGYTDLGLRKYGYDEKIRNILTAIQAAGNRAADLTSQLLAFSRKQIISPKIIDINETILKLEKMLKRIIEEHIQLELFLAPGLPNIKADPVQIEQILMNLVVNARDAIHALPPDSPNDKRIQIETEQVTLNSDYAARHKGVKEGAFICISVSDSGVGMDESVLNKIFDPFFTTKEVGKGTGLGLSTVYGIIKQNNGNVYVYSEPGKGTTIKIYWPVCREEQNQTEETPKTDQAALKGNETVLLVEDDPFVREVGRDALMEFGYNVITAASGDKALLLVNEKNLKPQLLITDLIMPTMSGIELAAHIREKIPNIKIIYTSGYTENLIVKNGVLEEGIHFIQKPYQILQFIQTVRHVLDGK